MHVIFLQCEDLLGQHIMTNIYLCAQSSPQRRRSPDLELIGDVLKVHITTAALHLELRGPQGDWTHSYLSMTILKATAGPEALKRGTAGSQGHCAADWWQTNHPHDRSMIAQKDYLAVKYEALLLSQASAAHSPRNERLRGTSGQLSRCGLQHCRREVRRERRYA